MKMSAVNENPIEIKGAPPLGISGTSKNETVHTSRQLLYYTDSTNRFYLSKQSCVALEMIPNDFPSLGATPADSSCNVTYQTSRVYKRICECPTRKPPPAPPLLLSPFLPPRRIERNLKTGYSSTTHQVLLTYANTNHYP